jgi:phosphoserine phosphatase
LSQLTWVFDLCGTLFRENTTFCFVDNDTADLSACAKYVRRRRSTSLRIFNRASYAIGVDVLRYAAARAQFGKLRTALLEQTSAMLPRLSPVREPMRILEECQSNGNRVIMATASFDFIADRIASELGIVEVVSTQLSYDENHRCSGRIHDDILGRKVDALQGRLSGPFNVVTDNLDDLPLVRAAQHAYIVSRRRNERYWRRVSNASVIHVYD